MSKTPAKKKTEYYVDSIFSEKNHKIMESYKVGSLKKVKKILLEMLNLPVGEDGLPKEPVLEELQKNLSDYIGEDSIKSEFKRMKKAWKSYSEILSDLNDGITFIDHQFDKNYKIQIEVGVS